MTDKAKAAAAILLQARNRNSPIARLPEEVRPDDYKDAYAIQREVALAMPAVVGWKAGKFPKEAEPVVAPIFSGSVLSSGTDVKSIYGIQGLFEVEVGFRARQDISIKSSRKEIEENVDIFLIVEILKGRFSNILDVSKEELLADCNANDFIVLPKKRHFLSVEENNDFNIFADGELIAHHAIVLQEAFDTFEDMRKQIFEEDFEIRAGHLFATGALFTPFKISKSLEVRYEDTVVLNLSIEQKSKRDVRISR